MYRSALNIIQCSEGVNEAFDKDTDFLNHLAQKSDFF